jgi:hypothetical protein
VGDYVIVHAGFALSRVDEEEAKKIFEYLQQIGDLAELDLSGENRPTDASSSATRGGDGSSPSGSGVGVLKTPGTSRPRPGPERLRPEA